MAELSSTEIEDLLRPYLSDCTAYLLEKLGLYLDLLVKWNSRTNLTAIRDPQEMVRRHFGECLFAARHVGEVEALLDFGSGAGFPGIPIALLRPEIAVTLAESQGKKAAFLREAVRVLGLRTEVWAGRAETMTAETSFGCVTLRSVDGMAGALSGAWGLAAREVLVMSTRSGEPKLKMDAGFELAERIGMPCSLERVLLRYYRRGEMFHVEQQRGRTEE